MSIDKIHRFNSYINGESIFLKDSPTGTLINTTMLLSTLQRRVAELKKHDNPYDSIVKGKNVRGAITELEDIIRALGEEPL